MASRPEVAGGAAWHCANMWLAPLPSILSLIMCAGAGGDHVCAGGVVARSHEPGHDSGGDSELLQVGGSGSCLAGQGWGGRVQGRVPPLGVPSVGAALEAEEDASGRVMGCAWQPVMAAVYVVQQARAQPRKLARLVKMCELAVDSCRAEHPHHPITVRASPCCSSRTCFIAAEHMRASPPE